MRYDKAEFKAAYGTFSQLPDSDLPEIAFAAATCRKGLAFYLIRA